MGDLMNRNSAIDVSRLLTGLALLGLGIAPVGAAMAQGQGEFVVEKIAEKPIAALPDGDLYWTIETFAKLDEAEAAVGDTGLAAEIDGKAWLFTLGPQDDDGNGGEVIASVGPIQRFDASGYKLQINAPKAPPGAKTTQHSHPGSEVLYILSGEATVKWPDHTDVIGAGESGAGQPPHTPMEVTSTGEEDLAGIVMFVVDPSQDFARPEQLA
jgi:quercetin dioxygenase-like cupin family protein